MGFGEEGKKFRGKFFPSSPISNTTLFGTEIRIKQVETMGKISGIIAMLIATVIWGTGFSAQSRGAQLVDEMLFIMLRSIVGVLALIPVIAAFDLFRMKRFSFWGNAATVQEKKFLLTGGFWCGAAITAASFLQQCGIKYVSAGKTGFLTALYIIIVPVLGIFFKRKTSPVLWLAVVIAMGGTRLLCGGIGSLGLGEWLVIGCAVLYSLHILVIDHYAAKCDCIRLSCLQFLTAAVFSAAVSLITRESWAVEGICSSMPFWLFCGIGSSAVAFTLQIAAQKYLHPVTASLLMSLESVFAVIAGSLFLKEHLSSKELMGCSVIFLAIILAQIPFSRTKKQGSVPDKG